jgi:hypothetical protein
MSGYARQRHGTVDELDSTGVFTGMQGSNHVHWNANVNVREHERGENSQQRPGRHAGLSHQINAEYCEQLAHTNVRYVYYFPLLYCSMKSLPNDTIFIF